MKKSTWLLHCLLAGSSVALAASAARRSLAATRKRVPRPQAKDRFPHFIFVAQLRAGSPNRLGRCLRQGQTPGRRTCESGRCRIGSVDGTKRRAQSGMNGYQPPYVRYNRYGRGEFDFAQQIAQSASPEEQQSEALAVRPDGVAFEIVVSASFAIDLAKPQK